MNREHYVSRALLEAVWQGESGGNVYGLTFLRGDRNNPTPLGINSLTAKVLCEGHNRALGRFDTEMTKFFRAMEGLVLGEITGNPVATTSYVSGDAIERWMLKTMCGGVFSGNFRVPFVNSFQGTPPTDECLRIIFREAPFPAGEGVYVSAPAGSQVNHHVFSLAVVGDPTGIVGLRAWVFGFLFTLALTGDHTEFPELVGATYRPARIVSANTRNAIALSWTGDHTGRPMQLTLSDAPPP